MQAKLLYMMYLVCICDSVWRSSGLLTLGKSNGKACCGLGVREGGLGRDDWLLEYGLCENYVSDHKSVL